MTLTTFNNNYVDYLYVRYIPDGTNWPNETLYNNFTNEAYSMIPGMNLEEVPSVSDAIDSNITFQYKTSESETLLYKQTLQYFGYEEMNGIYTNKLNNEVMIEMSSENVISITAPTK